MPQNGYWVECVPVLGENLDETSTDGAGLYLAAIASIPEARVIAKTPENAIQQLRDKLASVRHEYCQSGKDLPAHDNPVRPPRNTRLTKGWISVYVKMADCCRNI